ncbi:MAG TPA: phosphatidate cytidylyltransferase [Candidatus Binataceae bacterium]|nr:phosphatidate cytidylyltransferase [Candidatus Binataceae bacterium]
MLRTRLWTAAVALPAVLLILVLAPGWFFSIFIGVLGIWGLYEIAGMTGLATPAALLILAGAGAVPLLAILARGDPGWMMPGAIFAVMLALVAAVARFGAEAGPKGLALTLIAAAWVGVLFPYFALLRNLPDGLAMIILMLLLVIASDTGAYFGGTYLGRHRLAPLVSPNKTIEGALAGAVSSVIVGLILRDWLAYRLTWSAIAILSLLEAILAQFGDLAGSAVKRSAGVKDSGWIFPGHGGLLDRTCSLVFACAFTYYFTK